MIAKFGGCDINTDKLGNNKGCGSGCRRSCSIGGLIRGLRRCVAFTLAVSMICSQSIAQVRLSTGGDITVSDSVDNPFDSIDTSVETIRLAQATTWPGEIDIDIDPPVIDHEALESGRSGESQEFSAGVVDDRGLKHVMLFHRNRSGAQYESAEMQIVEGSDTYTVTIDTELGQTRVEYYIEALDTGGNRVLKGFPFFPLVRELAAPTASVAEAPDASEPDNRLIYVLLGVAAVGLLVALAGGSSDSGNGGGTPDPGVDTVPLNIQVTPP